MKFKFLLLFISVLILLVIIYNNTRSSMVNVLIDINNPRLVNNTSDNIIIVYTIRKLVPLRTGLVNSPYVYVSSFSLYNTEVPLTNTSGSVFIFSNDPQIYGYAIQKPYYLNNGTIPLLVTDPLINTKILNKINGIFIVDERKPQNPQTNPAIKCFTFIDNEYFDVWKGPDKPVLSLTDASLIIEINSTIGIPVTGTSTNASRFIQSISKEPTLLVYPSNQVKPGVMARAITLPTGPYVKINDNVDVMNYLLTYYNKLYENSEVVNNFGTTLSAITSKFSNVFFPTFIIDPNPNSRTNLTINSEPWNAGSTEFYRTYYTVMSAKDGNTDNTSLYANMLTDISDLKTPSDPVTSSTITSTQKISIPISPVTNGKYPNTQNIYLFMLDTFINTSINSNLNRGVAPFKNSGGTNLGLPQGTAGYITNPLTGAHGIYSVPFVYQTQTIDTSAKPIKVINSANNTAQYY